MKIEIEKKLFVTHAEYAVAKFHIHTVINSILKTVIHTMPLTLHLQIGQSHFLTPALPVISHVVKFHL